MNALDAPDLATTRRQLFNYLSESQPPKPGAAARKQQNRSAQQQQPDADPGPVPGLDWSALVRAGLSSWWHDHPARAAASLLRSATEEYAQKKPLQVVTIAALAGASIVVFKPWRLVSTTALMLSLFRSSNFTGMATSVLETAAQSMQRERP